MTSERQDLSAHQNIPAKSAKDFPTWTITPDIGCEKVYTCDEAIDLTGGKGWYVYTLAIVLAFAIMGMTLDMIGLSVVVTSACDLELTQAQQSIVMSMPFLGSVISAYPWGYIADTQGRLKALKIALWTSFILATLSAFSPNWIVFAILRLGSSSFSSGIHSLSLTLLGESCPSRLKGPALIAVLSLMFYTFGVYNASGYFILGLDFVYDLGFIVFSPWRLIALVLSIPLGVSTIFIMFYYESPKFLLNAGDEINAIKILRKISKRNGLKENEYPVQRVVFNEMTQLRKDVPLLQSLKEQFVPLFKPPYLYRSLQLFFITAVLYSNNNGYFAWMPFVTDKLSSLEANDTSSNFCEMITSYQERNTTSICITSVSEFTVQISFIQSTACILLSLVAMWLSSWKKEVHLAVLLTSVVCGVCLPFTKGWLLTVVLFYGFLINCVSMPITFSYYVDVFPTSYRGMATCLGVMVARISALIGTNIVGAYLVSHCTGSLYSWSAFIMCGLLASVFLPANKPKKLC
ncbi:synaptic vesicle 2-related protein-like [Melitaea cinxia]|uniref:synaptic vesicle 2-related protein-like n=1 Tax=Melitaea cinxia TaxID=113334 RepID=UPI001E273951|nr:synaptic vesicle 2-related protein-like [Melitaea cinxia]